MKKMAFVIGFVLVISLAMPAMAGGNGAVIYKNMVCEIYTGDYGTVIPGNPGFGSFLTEDSRFIMNGNIQKLICHGHLTENFPSKAVMYGNTTGDFPYGGADAWQVVITPSGEATLTAYKKLF